MQYRQRYNCQRHKIIPPEHGKGVRLIDDLPELHRSLQDAVFLELFTIPPYLCALYSLKDGKMGTNREVYDIIRSVAMEEMLHMIMAANILTAVGGTPSICDAKRLPMYPAPMPHSAIGFVVNLLKFSKEAVNTFLRIERPAERGSTEQWESPAGKGEKREQKFWSIGDFYAAVREAMNRLDLEAREDGDTNGIFTGNKQHQVTDQNYYGGGGKLVAVYTVDDANRAIDEITGQGEGIDGTIDDGDDAMFDEDVELAHYFRFNEIFCERRYQPGDKPGDAPSGGPLQVDWDAVHNMIPNPTMDVFKNQPGVLKKATAFNRTYTKMLEKIQEACSGRQEVLLEAANLMHALREQAVEPMKEESGVGDFTAGPSFEYVP